jgi:hypothetical protein
MTDRVCVFVDGENFRHSIGDLFRGFSKSDYLPLDADWGALFDWFVQEASGDGRRIRTYWYVVENLDPQPFHLPNPSREPEKLREVLRRDSNIRRELNSIKDEDELNRRATQIFNRLSSLKGAKRKRFDGWKNVHDSISANHPAIQFRKAGSLRHNLFRDTLGPEKAVDVKLAVDLIMLRNTYDLAVIVSGDQDYVPAVDVVKDSGKQVVNVAFKTQDGTLLPSGAARLNQATDWKLEIPYDDLKAHLNL